MQAISRLFQSISGLTQPSVQTKQTSPLTRQTVDCLVIMGPGTERIRKAQELSLLRNGLTSVFIGDGRRGITKKLIHDARSQGLIGPNTQIICIAHGSAQVSEDNKGSTHHLRMQPDDNAADSSEPATVATQNFLRWFRDPLTSPNPTEPPVPGFAGNIHLVSCSVGNVRKEKVRIPTGANGTGADEISANQLPVNGYTFFHGGNKILSSASSDESLESLYSYLRDCKTGRENPEDPDRMLERIKEHTYDTVILLDESLKEVKKYPAPKNFWDIFPNRRDEIMREYERDSVKNQPVAGPATARTPLADASKRLMDRLSSDEKTMLGKFFMVRLQHLKTKEKLNQLGQQIATDPRLANIKLRTRTLLMWAADNRVNYKNAEINSGDVVDTLIKSGARVEARDALGRTVAHHAAENGNVEALKVLYQKIRQSDTHDQKLGINDRDIYGRTVAYYAANAGHVEALELLLDEKANMESVTWSGLHTLLHGACESRRQRLKTVQCVLRRGGQSLINKRNFFGKTALHIAIMTGDAATVKLLLDSGADPTQRTFGLSTPSDLARKLPGEASQKILELLKNAKAKKNTPT